MKRRTLAGLILALLTFPVYAQKIKTDYSRTTDFGKYKTYAWRAGHALGGSEMLPLELIDKYVRASVTRELNSKGMKEVTINPDAYVSFFVGLEDKTTATPLNSFDHYGKVGYQAAEAFGGTWDDVMVQNYRKGVLLIDFVDAASNTLVWRAHCKETASKPGDAQGRIDAAAKKALQGFPPKTKS